MIEVSSPLQVLALAAALGWPFLAGLGVVLWSKARSAERRRRTAEMETRLQGLFRSVEAQPPPERLMLVIDALEEAEALRLRADPKAGRKTAAPAA